MKLWLLVHWVGLILWLGPGIAAMLMTIRARAESLVTRAALARLLAPVYSTLMGPGALLTAVSGVVLTMRIARTGADMSSPGLLLMQSAGLLGALIVLFAVLPAAGKLARAAAQVEASGEIAPGFLVLRRRLVVGSSVSGTLGIIALFAVIL